MDARDLALVIVAIVEVVIGLALYVTNNRSSGRIDEHQSAIESHNDQMRRIQTESSAALVRMAEALEKRLTAPAHTGAADVRVKWRGEHRREAIVIVNEGTASADIVDIETIGDASLLVAPKLPTGGLVLRPRDSFVIRAAPSLATPPLVDVRVTWVDASGSHQADFTISTV